MTNTTFTKRAHPPENYNDLHILNLLLIYNKFLGAQICLGLRTLQTVVLYRYVALAMIDLFIIRTSKLSSPAIYGNYKYSIDFSANSGQSLMPVEKVASGGERNRLFLVLKSLLKGCQLLKKSKCKFIVIPCNTAHYNNNQLSYAGAVRRAGFPPAERAGRPRRGGAPQRAPLGVALRNWRRTSDLERRASVCRLFAATPPLELRRRAARS